MKKILIITAFLFGSFLSVNAQVTNVVLGVDGFTCSLCAKGVEGQLKGLDFVKSVKANIKSSTFTITFNQSNIDINALKDAVIDGGFTVRDVKITAKGEINGSSASGFTFVTTGIPSFSLKNVSNTFNAGDKVNVTGSVISSNQIKVIKITKL